MRCRTRLVVPSWAMEGNLNFVPGAVRCQSFYPGNWCQKVCRLETTALVLGREGKDDDREAGVPVKMF